MITWLKTNAYRVLAALTASMVLSALIACAAARRETVPAATDKPIIAPGASQISVSSFASLPNAVPLSAVALVAFLGCAATAFALATNAPSDAKAIIALYGASGVFILAALIMGWRSLC